MHKEIVMDKIRIEDEQFDRFVSAIRSIASGNSSGINGLEIVGASISGDFQEGFEYPLGKQVGRIADSIDEVIESIVDISNSIGDISNNFGRLVDFIVAKKEVK
jgi:hypothetical protein